MAKELLLFTCVTKINDTHGKHLIYIASYLDLSCIVQLHHIPNESTFQWARYQTVSLCYTKVGYSYIEYSRIYWSTHKQVSKCTRPSLRYILHSWVRLLVSHIFGDQLKKSTRRILNWQFWALHASCINGSINGIRNVASLVIVTKFAQTPN